MLLFSKLVQLQLSCPASVKHFPRQVSQYSTVPLPDDIFTESHRTRCSSRLHPIEPGIADLRPTWKIPGTRERVQSIKMAAVLVPLCFVDKVPSVLLTVRSSRLLAHKAEVRYILV